MRVLIVGEGKSGTTALLRSVAESLDSPSEIFEPQLMTKEDLTPNPLVVKKLLLNWKPQEKQLLDSFDRRLFIVRDPRDRLISHLLYDAYNKAHLLSPKQQDKWMSLLAKKVEKPRSVSVLHLVNTWWRLSRADLMSHYVRALDRSTAYSRRHGGQFHTLHYEDYVDGNFADVDNYLGLSLSTGVVKGSEERVARSSTHGEWRRWFKPVDVKMFRTMSHEWLGAHGYDPTDWELTKPAEPLDPATTTEYVQSLFERRAGLNRDGS